MGRTKHMLLRKGFHQVKVKYGSNQLAKVGVEDGSSLHSFFGYCQHMIELLPTKDVMNHVALMKI